ncbi:MAG: hypothetical protein IIA67_15240, partial [Planctomycetes bacterium]|nr:hypothetical protein [Planctomycetota bacterium]
MAGFASDTVEGAIERKYMPSLKEMGLGAKEASEAILDFAQKATGKPVIPNKGDRLLE